MNQKNFLSRIKKEPIQLGFVHLLVLLLLLVGLGVGVYLVTKTPTPQPSVTCDFSKKLENYGCPSNYTCYQMGAPCQGNNCPKQYCQPVITSIPGSTPRQGSGSTGNGTVTPSN